MGLDESLDRLLMEHRRDYVAAIAPVPEKTAERLRRLRSDGWRIGVVTNGDAVQVEKLKAAQVAGFVDDCCVSGLVGFRKPAREIFELAAQRCGAPLEGAWMIGDNPLADIGGAAGVGIKSAWIHHGRSWSESEFEPDLIVSSIDEAREGISGAVTAG